MFLFTYTNVIYGFSWQTNLAYAAYINGTAIALSQNAIEISAFNNNRQYFFVRTANKVYLYKFQNLVCPILNYFNFNTFECMSCSVNCSTCNDNLKCATCYTNFTFNSVQSCVCQQNMTLINSTTCNCISGYLIINGTCKLPPVCSLNCLECDYVQCLTCKTGFNMVNSFCISPPVCSLNCLECDYVKCFTCITGFILVNDTCL